MTILVVYGAAGWGLFLFVCVCWNTEACRLEKKLASAEIEAQLWKERCDATVDALETRDRAIEHQHMEIEALTPKRGARGKFASKRAI